MPAFASDAFGDENASDARRPHHSGGVELDELHVDQLGARFVGERMAIARVFPAVARDLVGAADSAGRQHDRLCAKDLESSSLALVPERADDPVARPSAAAVTVHSMWTSMPM